MKVGSENPKDHLPLLPLFTEFNPLAISSRTRASQRSLAGIPACPLTFIHVTVWNWDNSTSSFQRSAFLTGFLLAVFHPFCYHLRYQRWFIPLMRYAESE